MIDFLNRPAVIRGLVPVSEREENGVKIREERWVEGDVVRKRIWVSDHRGSRRYEERVKMYSRDQMEEMMQRAGLSVQQVWGDFEGNPHSEHSRRMIIAGWRSQGNATGAIFSTWTAPSTGGSRRFREPDILLNNFGSGGFPTFF